MTNGELLNDLTRYGIDRCGWGVLVYHVRWLQVCSETRVRWKLESSANWPDLIYKSRGD